MNLTDDLQKLQSLRESGALTEEEFSRAKQKLLDGPAAPGPAVHEELAELRLQNDLRRLDDDWRAERESFLMAGRYGGRYLPTKARGIYTAVVALVFGGLWTAAVTATTNRHGGVGNGWAFPLFGLAVIAAVFGLGVYTYRRAEALAKAEARYRQRRAELLGREEPRP